MGRQRLNSQRKRKIEGFHAQLSHGVPTEYLLVGNDPFPAGSRPETKWQEILLIFLFWWNACADVQFAVWGTDYFRLLPARYLSSVLLGTCSLPDDRWLDCEGDRIP